MSSEAEAPVYFDHGATSWPKPGAVREHMLRFLDGVVANAGRSGHGASVRSARLVFEVREKMAGLLGVPDPRNLVFTRGTTEGLNLVLKGFLGPGDRVLVSPLEHNSVMRPLRHLEGERGLRVETLPADPFGRVDVRAAGALSDPDPPRLIVLAHVSNVNGAVQDLAALRRAFPETPILSDAAQAAGVLPIDVAAQGIDFLACSAHKGLLGPTGVGFCTLKPGLEVTPLIQGGTGSRSESMAPPTVRPDRYEGGTQNLHGIAGVQGALEHIEAKGLLGEHKRRLCGMLLDGLRLVPGLHLHSPADGTALLVSFTIEGLTPSEVAHRLEQEQGILSRPGLQCAPAAHHHLGTFPQGTIRLSPGFGNTEEHARQAVEAVRAVAGRRTTG
jgi:selenocysteine lyase/cysteine desulfurase